MRIISIAILSLLLVHNVTILRAAQNVNEPEKVPIEKIIEGLGSSNFLQRQEAAKSLKMHGPESLAQLRQAVGKVRDAEVQRMLNSAIANLEERELLTPTFMNLALNQVSVSEALDELSESSGQLIQIWPDDDRNAPWAKRLVSLNVKKEPFWKVLHQFCRSSGLKFRGIFEVEKKHTLSLAVSEVQNAHVSLSGPFRVALNASMFNRSFEYTQGDQNIEIVKAESLDCMLRICTEGNAQLAAVGRTTITQATDEEGQKLDVPQIRSNNNQMYPSRQRDESRTLSLRPLLAQKQLQSLKGSIAVRLLSKRIPVITIKDILRNNKELRETDRYVLELISVLPEGRDNYVAHVQFVQKDEESPFSAGSIRDRIEFQDATGQPYPKTMGRLQGVGNSFKVILGFRIPRANEIDARASPKVKLVFNDWKTIDYDIPFEFQNVQLP